VIAGPMGGGVFQLRRGDIRRCTP